MPKTKPTRGATKRAAYVLPIELVEAVEQEVVRLRKVAGADADRKRINQSSIVAAALQAHFAKRRSD